MRVLSAAGSLVMVIRSFASSYDVDTSVLSAHAEKRKHDVKMTDHRYPDFMLFINRLLLRFCFIMSLLSIPVVSDNAISAPYPFHK